MRVTMHHTSAVSHREHLAAKGNWDWLHGASARESYVRRAQIFFGSFATID